MTLPSKLYLCGGRGAVRRKIHEGCPRRLARVSGASERDLDSTWRLTSQVTVASGLSKLLTASLLWLLFRLAPTGIGVVFLHGLAECFGLLAEVLLINNAILVHDECHHTGGALFGGISYEGESLGHSALHYVTL
jgi:hypothetical protein